MRSAGVPMGIVRSNTNPHQFGSGATNAAPSSPSVEELVAFERMLADLSARMANVPADRVEPEIQLAQVILRQFLGFDRSTFAEFQDDSSLVVVSSTAIEGVDPTPLGPLPPQLAWFIAKLRAGETLVIQNPADDLPPEAVGEPEYIQRTGLRSHLSIPLRIGGRVVGAIAFSAFRETRNWPDDLIARDSAAVVDVREGVRQLDGQTDRGDRGRVDERASGLPLARQYPRAAERDR